MKAYEKVIQRIGDPLKEETLYGPLHNADAVRNFTTSIDEAKKLGAKIEFGGNVSYKISI